MEWSSRTSEEVCLRTHHLNGSLLETLNDGFLHFSLSPIDMMSEAIDQTVDKGKSEEETEDPTDQVGERVLIRESWGK
ncbi:hypothetical protein F2Q70_00032036 [Brassica cretica]|uniref:Uncharacterized protein n=1 Tax=Brassica cretica TaxID=69181 RepID=A0A8S9FNF1_BRACR|nr:hypothetical protein F2Q70_00032036 [Brassica cretica]